MLASRVEPERVLALDHRLAPVPPFAGLEVADEASLRCVYADAAEPYLVHQFLSPKPWEGPTYDGVYSRLLRRLLGESDSALVPPRDSLPLRLRRGSLAYAERRRIDFREQVRWRLGG